MSILLFCDICIRDSLFFIFSNLLFFTVFFCVNLFVTILLINIFFKTSSLTSAINVPSLATEIFPVSSDTTTTILSDSFEIPIAALCLVPNSLAISDVYKRQQYTLALACPMLAYAFSVPSEFASTKKKKVTLFYIYVIGLTIIVTSMFTQWLNMGAWLLLIFNPGYVDLVTNFSDLIRPALTSLTLLMPILIIPKIFNFLYFGVNDSKDMKRCV